MKNLISKETVVAVAKRRKFGIKQVDNAQIFTVK